MAIKCQTLSNFIAEFIYQPTSLELAKEFEPSPSSLWHLYVDESSTDNYSGAGVILVSPEGVRLKYQAKGEKITFYLEKAKELLGQFDTVTITQIPRNENSNADTLAGLRSFSSPNLTCLNEYQAKYVLQEVHEGVCGNHSSSRALAHKVLRQGYYWPTIQADSLAFVQKCDKC
ncbi:hypothetical protein UlMin_000072 [Ulmus minor]